MRFLAVFLLLTLSFPILTSAGWFGSSEKQADAGPPKPAATAPPANRRANEHPPAGAAAKKSGPPKIRQDIRQADLKETIKRLATTPTLKGMLLTGSCRSFKPTPIDLDNLKLLVDAARKTTHGLLTGSPITLKITDKDTGVYGNVFNPPHSLIGAIGRFDGLPHPELVEADFGYAMEKVNILARSHGIGSIWLSLTYDEQKCRDILGARKDEGVFGMNALGYWGPTTLKTKTGKSWTHRTHPRLQFEQLFSKVYFKDALRREKAGEYHIPLEAVRMGPSAKNTQRWRIIQDGGHRRHTLFLDTSGVEGQKWMYLDAGIAMARFETAAKELGLEGRWVRQGANGEPYEGFWKIRGKPDHFQYVATWSVPPLKDEL